MYTRDADAAHAPLSAATIPDQMYRLLNHPAISLNRYEQDYWPIAWERDKWGELVPEMSIDLVVDRGWCVGSEGQHGLTVESLTDVECALADLCQCECGECVDESDRYCLEDWA